MQWSASLAKLLDPYDLKARLLPGLLVLSPAITYFGLIMGSKNPLLVTLGSIVAVCGGPYLLASFVRTWGQRAQDRLFEKWGGQPSTLMLRHREKHLPVQTKLQYHSLIGSKLGISMPTPDEEAVDPGCADQAYIAAANALRPMTSDKKKYDMIFKELVAYGYNRNAHGSRLLGLAVALVVAVTTLFDARVLLVVDPFVQRSELDAKHGLVLLVCLVLALLWTAHFTERTVRRSGFSYALRLWEALEKVSKKPTPKGGPKANP